MSSGRPRGRPTRFTPEIAAQCLGIVQSGIGLDDCADFTGVSRRALGNWLRRGRSGEVPFANWATEMYAAVERWRRLRVRKTHERNRERSKQRWQAFRKARVEWWRERLGPRLFLLRRVAWLREQGHDAAIARLLSE